MERRVLQLFTVIRDVWNKAVAAGVASKWLTSTCIVFLEGGRFGFVNEKILQIWSGVKAFRWPAMLVGAISLGC
jgi:hypothetical protein